MRTEESLARFFTRLTNNLFVVMACFMAALIASSLLPPLRVFRPLLVELVLPLGVLGVLFWTAVEAQSGGPARLQALLRKRLYERAFQLALRKGQLEEFEHQLLSGLALPSELLRSKIRAAFSELRILHQSLHDPANRFIDGDLHRAMRERTDEARRALWKLCENLEVVASQKIRFADDHAKMQRIGGVLADLAQSTGEVRVKLAELTLAPQQAELEEARIAIDQVRRQSEALLEWETISE